VAQGATILDIQPLAQADAMEEVTTPRDLGRIHFLIEIKRKFRYAELDYTVIKYPPDSKWRRHRRMPAAGQELPPAGKRSCGQPNAAS